MHKSLSILIAFLLLAVIGQSQNYAPKDYYLIDSLSLEDLTISDKEIINNSLILYHKAADDTSKIKALDNICENMMDKKWTNYQYIQHQIINEGLAANPNETTKKFLLKALAKSLNNIGFIHKNEGNIQKAISYYQKSLKTQKQVNDKPGIASTLNNIGIIYKNKGDLKSALDYYQQSLMIREELKDKKGIALAFNNIGMVYQQQKDYKNALDYNQKSLMLREEINDLHGIAMSNNNMGVISGALLDDDKALEYHLKAHSIYTEIGKLSGVALSLNNIGSIYNKQANKLSANKGNADSIKLLKSNALEFYLKSYNSHKNLSNREGMLLSAFNIAWIYFESNQVNKSKKNALLSLKYAQELGYPDNIKNAANLLSKIYETENDGMKALKMYKLYTSMQDSINNEENQKAIAQQQAKYEYEKQKALDDAQNEKLIAIELEEKEKQKILTYATAVGLGIVIIFLIFVFNRLQVTKKQKSIIVSQKEAVESAHQEIKDSITYAKRIQSAILPTNKVVKEYLKESFILYKPKDVVAGDFYWMESVSSSRHSGLDPESSQKDNETLKDEIADTPKDVVLFAAADCTGHGVPGAMVSVVCNNALNRAVREYGLTEPGKILDKTREIVIEEFEKSDENVRDGMDIALCSLEGNTLKYAGAHNPLWIVRNGEILETKADKQPIGRLFDKLTSYTTHTIELIKGDSIYIFSDGYADQFGGEKGKKFKTKAFRELLLSIQENSMEQQKEIINDNFENWKGELEQIDDVCVIGVRV